MYVGHKNINLQNVPPTFCKFMSGHIFDISFHLPPQCAALGEEPHAAAPRHHHLARHRRTPPPHAVGSLAPLVYAEDFIEGGRWRGGGALAG